MSLLLQVVYSHHSRHTWRMRLLNHVACDLLLYERLAYGGAAFGQFICQGETDASPSHSRLSELVPAVCEW